MPKVELISLLTAETVVFDSYQAAASYADTNSRNVTLAASKYRRGDYSYRLALKWFVRANDIGKPWPFDVLQEPLYISKDGTVHRYPPILFHAPLSGKTIEYPTIADAADAHGVTVQYLKNHIHRNTGHYDSLFQGKYRIRRKDPSTDRTAVRGTCSNGPIILKDLETDEQRTFEDVALVAEFLNTAKDAVISRLFALTTMTRSVPIAGRYILNHQYSN